MADRFYCPDSPVDGRLTLIDDEARHLSRVRRVGVGESVEVFDGRGNAYRAEVIAIGRDRVDLNVVDRLVSIASPPISLTLATAVPKGDRFDWLVEKATELGVERLIPMMTERSTVDPRSAKLDRIRRAVVEASKQCRRDELMIVEEPTPFETLIANAWQQHRLIAHPSGPPILTAGRLGWKESVIVAIGPEGGFTNSEIDLAVRSGWTKVGLGPGTLRVETAAIASAAAIMVVASFQA